MKEKNLKQRLRELIKEWESIIYIEKMIGGKYVAMTYEACVAELEKALGEEDE